MTGQPPPPDVAAAAARVDAWLKAQATQRVSEEQYAKMSHAEKIDYCRQFPQVLPDGRR